jgi:hypothetical protein
VDESKASGKGARTPRSTAKPGLIAKAAALLSNLGLTAGGAPRELSPVRVPGQVVKDLRIADDPIPVQVRDEDASVPRTAAGLVDTPAAERKHSARKALRWAMPTDTTSTPQVSESSLPFHTLSGGGEVPQTPTQAVQAAKTAAAAAARFVTPVPRQTPATTLPQQAVATDASSLFQDVAPIQTEAHAVAYQTLLSIELLFSKDVAGAAASLRQWAKRFPDTLHNVELIIDGVSAAALTKTGSLDAALWPRVVQLAHSMLAQSSATVTPTPSGPDSLLRATGGTAASGAKAPFEKGVFYDFGNMSIESGPAMIGKTRAIGSIGWVPTGISYSIEAIADRKHAVFGAVARVQDLRLLADASALAQLWARHDFTLYEKSARESIQAALLSGRLPSLRWFVTNGTAGGSEWLSVDGLLTCIQRAITMLRDVLGAPDEDLDAFSLALQSILDEDLVDTWVAAAREYLPTTLPMAGHGAYYAEFVMKQIDHAVAIWHGRATVLVRQAFAEAAGTARAIQAWRVTGAIDVSDVALPLIAEQMHGAPVQLGESVVAKVLKAFGAPMARQAHQGASQLPAGRGRARGSKPSLASRASGVLRDDSEAAKVTAGPEDDRVRVDVDSLSAEQLALVSTALRDGRRSLHKDWAKSHPVMSTLVSGGLPLCFRYLRGQPCNGACDSFVGGPFAHVRFESTASGHKWVPRVAGSQQ